MFDVAIIGGGFAGLTAALQLGRASRSVIVIDAGEPRNRTSPAAHGVAGWEGAAPSEILDRFRSDLDAYDTVSQIIGRVQSVFGAIDGFELALSEGETLAARRLVLAHGVTDGLPDIEGLAPAWGTRVLHCPYCHGYEVRNQPLAVLAVHPLSAHQALMLRADWSDAVTLITGGMEGFDADALASAGVTVDDRALARADAHADGVALTMSDGETAQVAALFLGPRTSLSGSPADQLGCATADGPMGPYVRIGPMGQTTVAGVFAAGDLTRPTPNINFALADGAQAGAGSHASLVFPDFVMPLETVT